ncbi:uncharacterized protein LOC111027769, partial [Myzus persicae]|uniref:uncharacterized protein LOC111027769 n=1 Tax=Myzus persicae TaxID=13164 RepID=UPI000B936691
MKLNFTSFFLHIFLLCGDYNLPEISWSNDSHGLTYTSSSALRVPCVPELLAFNGFYQKNTILNFKGSILDLICCNIDSVVVTQSLEPFVPPDPYHPPLKISFPYISTPNICNSSHSFLNFKNADYDSIINFLSYFDWYSTLSNLDLNTAVYTFTDALHNSILRSVPISRFYKSSFPTWVSKDLKSLIYRKNKAHAKFKCSFDPADYTAFSLLRAKCKYTSKKCNKEFVEKSEKSLSSNPKNFWDFVRKNRSHNAVPNTVSLIGVNSSSKLESVNLFAKHFSSVYPPEPVTSNLQILDIQFFDLPNNCYFSANDVLLKLNTLENVSSIGPDGIPGYFLYKTRFIIFYPLWILFRRSHDDSTFPDMWKIGSITPILKSGCRTSVTNYRPISILGHNSKLFESLVLDAIQPSVNLILANEQHGYRTGRSTVTCNLVFCNYIFGYFKNGTQVDVIYTDFAKAFDSVNHEVLISVLRATGFGDPILS